MGRLQGKVAFITGAGAGIAKASALAFIREGAKVALAEIKPELGRAAEKQARDAGGDAVFIETDVTQDTAVKRAIDAAVERYGRLDILMNCAGGSLVEDVIMPIVGSIFGKLDFTNLYVALGTVPEGTAPTLAALKEAGVPTLAYGNFITVAINFLILAFIIFVMVKQINRLKRDEPAAPAAPAPTPEEVMLLREIRDSLRK